MANVLYLGAEVPTAMTGFRKSRRFGKERRAIHEAEERWKKAGYPPRVIEKLDWDRRYSIVELGEDQYALSSYENSVVTVRTAWELGYVPVHGPGAVRGIDLPSVAPRLRGVHIDVDVEELHLQDPLGRDPETL